MKQDYEEKLYEAVKEVAKDLPLREAAQRKGDAENTFGSHRNIIGKAFQILG